MPLEKIEILPVDLITLSTIFKNSCLVSFWCYSCNSSLYKYSYVSKSFCFDVLCARGSIMSKIAKISPLIIIALSFIFVIKNIPFITLSQKPHDICTSFLDFFRNNVIINILQNCKENYHLMYYCNFYYEQPVTTYKIIV